MKGFSFVEILVALAISSVLLVMVLQFFGWVQQSFIEQQGLARIQENARTIDAMLQNAVRSSGRMGCNALGEDLFIEAFLPIVLKDYGLDLPQKKSTTWQELQQNPQVAPSVIKRLRKDSDILWLKSIKNISKGMKHKHVVVLSDCQRMQMLTYKQSRDPDYTQALIERGKNAKLSRLSSTLFYVGNTNRKNAAGVPIYALYATDLNGITQEWVEGVEFMQLEFGTTDGNLHQYLPANQINDWSQVKSVRIALLLSSVEDCLRAPRAYQIQQQSIKPDDRLLRRWWHYEWPVL